MIRLVLLVLMIVLFLWVLYIRRRERLELIKKKREGYQIFTFPYTTEAPNKDFRGEHPDYSYREFFREHFTEKGFSIEYTENNTSSSYCPLTPCTAITANSLGARYPIDVLTGSEYKGFVMTLEMGKLPKQYHYRTTHKKTDDSYYTGLDEAMVFNGFDINHERAYAPGHNPNVRGFIGQCQTLVSGCRTDSTGKRVCDNIDRYAPVAGDASSLQAFTHQSTALVDMKPGECIYEDKAKRYVWLKIGIQDRWTIIQTKRFGKTFMFAYGTKKSYIFKTFTMGLTPNNGEFYQVDIGAPPTQSVFGGDPYFLSTKAIYVAFEVNPQTYYQLREAYKESLIGNELFLANDHLPSYPYFDTVYERDVQFNVYDDNVLLNLRAYINTESNGANSGQETHRNVLRIVSREANVNRDSGGYGDPWWNMADISFGHSKYTYVCSIRGTFLEVEPDKINPLFDKEIIHAPPPGQNDSSELYGSSIFYGRTISSLDLTPSHLKHPISGICSMVNVSHANTSFPDNSDPNTTTFLTLNAASKDPYNTAPLNITGPSKISSSYTSNLLTLENHRNSIAYGGFVMNTLSVNRLVGASKANSSTQSTAGVLNNNCTVESNVSFDTSQKRQALLDSSIFGNCSADDLANPDKQCVANNIQRIVIALGILDPSTNFRDYYVRAHLLLIQWAFIDWFANYKGYPSDDQCSSTFDKIYIDYTIEIKRNCGYPSNIPDAWSLDEDSYIFLSTIQDSFKNSYVSKIKSYRDSGSYKNQALYKDLSNYTRNISYTAYYRSKLNNQLLSQTREITTRTISIVLERFLFDLYCAGSDTVKLKAIINSYHPGNIKRTWLYALYPEDRKRSRIYFDGYAADASNRWASGAFKVNDPYEIIDAYNNPLTNSTFKTALDNFVRGFGSSTATIYTGTTSWSYAGTTYPSYNSVNINLNTFFPLRSVVVPRRFTRGSSEQATLPNSFPRVYSVIKFYSSTGSVLFTLFWAHIPLYPGCGYPTMNFEITDKYGKPDYMNNNYHDNIFVFYLIGDDNDWKGRLRDNGVEPICEEDCYIESVYHGDALCLRAIDTPSKKLNCGNYASFAEDGLKATFAPSDPRSDDILGGEMGKFRIYVDQNGVFVFKTKISTNQDAVNEYTVYSDYITIPGMSSCASFSCWTPFREANGSQSVFKSILIENPDFSDATSTSKPANPTQPAELSATDSYKNIAQKREMIQTYAIFKNPCNPARVNTPVIRNVNVLKSEGWRIVNVGGAGWVDPKSTYLNYYKVNEKEDYSEPPLNLNYSTYEQEDKYGGTVGIMVSKWGLPTQEKYISRGEWLQLDLSSQFVFNKYSLRVPWKFVTSTTLVKSSNAQDRLAYNRTISEWTLVGSNDTTSSKNWVLIDYVKEADFRYNSSGTTAAGNQMSMQYSTFTATLTRSVNYRYVRLIINALDHGNFENIFTIAYFGVQNSDGVWKPTKGSVNPTDISVTTSILPYGFDNNYQYNSELKTPLTPLITRETYNSTRYCNACLKRGDTLYYKDLTCNECGGSPSDLYVGGMDNPFSYTGQIPFTNRELRNWERGTSTKNSVTEEYASIYTRDVGGRILKCFSQYTDDLNENTSSATYLNLTLGKHLFTWPEMRMFIDLVQYSRLMTYQNGDEVAANSYRYNLIGRYATYNYTKIVRDNTWNLKYNMTYDRRKDKFYEGSVITTYSLPCGVNDPSVCSSGNNPIPSTGYNNMRPDQEIADPRFCWPQPYQGGSYLVSDSVKCVSGQTCNSVGGNKDNVTPKYCFWIGDSETYNLLKDTYQFPVQQEFNMNIMFDGDTTVYNDVPLQCLGKLTKSNLDTTTPLSMFYPPPSLYRMKRWRLIDYSGGRTLYSGSTRLKNAIISENGKVVYTFPDVQTALAYKQYDAEEPTRVKVYNGCQGPSLVGTNVTISCPAGKLQASSGELGESTSHIRWGKWEASSCRDSFGDNLIQADYRRLPDKCVGQSSCTITESDFGWTPPGGIEFDGSGILKNVTSFEISYDASNSGTKSMQVSDIKIYSDETTLISGYSITASSTLDGDSYYPVYGVSKITDGLDTTFWHSQAETWPKLTISFTSPRNIYKILITNRLDCCSSRMAGLVINAFNGTDVLYVCNPFKTKGSSTTYSDGNDGYKYYHIYPGRSSNSIGSDSPSVTEPAIVSPYQKRQWQVGFVCDDSTIATSSSIYEIPSGVNSRQIHENYHNLMKTVHGQVGNTFDISSFPETLKWYQKEMEKELVESPEFKAHIRQENKKLYKNREHYWDGDICKPVGQIFNTAANGILDTIYNPMVNGINKIKILRNNLGLSPLNVNVGWSCPIPGLGEAIGAIVNAAIAVGKAFVAAFNFVCQLGEALVGALINTGKLLVNRLGALFSTERMRKFLGAFSNGMNGGFSLLGARIQENFSFVAEGALALANAASNFGSSVLNFFMNPSLDNFIGVVSSFLALGVESFVFILNIGVFLLTVLADVVGAIVNFFSDVGSWIQSSIIGPIVGALSSAASAVSDWILSLF